MEPTTKQGITARQLRDILFYVDEQEMTVRQLRYRLWDLHHQDKELNANKLANATRKTK